MRPLSAAPASAVVHHPERNGDRLEEIGQLNAAFRALLGETLSAGDRRSVVTKRHSPEAMRALFARVQSVYADLDGTCVPPGSTTLRRSLVRKMRILRDAGVKTTFVTGKPWSEVEDLIADLHNGDCPEIIFERGAFVLKRQEDGTMQLEDHLATPEMKERAITVREAFPALRDALEAHYGVRIVPAGDGGHRLVLSIDILRGDAPADYADHPRAQWKVDVAQDGPTLASIREDIGAFLQAHFPDWSVTDLGNANFELTPKTLTKHNAITPEHSLVIGDGGNDIEMFSLNAREDVHAAVVHHAHTPAELLDIADFGTSGEANAEVFFDKLILAKRLTRQVWIASNTPPFERKHDSTLGLKIGMPVALANMVERMDARNCRWVYVGDDDFRADRHGLQGKLIPVPITATERAAHYRAVSNETLWPLAHKPRVSTPVGEPSDEEWLTYEQVCGKVARGIDASLGSPVEGDNQPGRVIWIQDYQMIAVGEHLRRRRPAEDYTLGYYWHIPFPDAGSFIDGLGEERGARLLTQFSRYDLIGFHTKDYEQHYHAACERLGVPAARTRVKPISVDKDEIETIVRNIKAKGHAFARKELNELIDVEAIRKNPELRKNYILCGMERCDETKACIERLEAWKLLASRSPELLRGKTVIEVIVPSRLEIPYYAALYKRAKDLVAEINGILGETVIHHIDKIDSRGDVIAAMHFCGTFVVTPQADGFNMSAAEAAVVHAERGSGTLLLSNHMGFSASLHDHGLHEAAAFIDDLSPEGIAAALEDALQDGVSVSPARFAQLRTFFQIHTLRTWTKDNVDACMDAGFERDVLMAA